MNKRRIFIAINLPEKIRKRLKEYQEKFDHLPVRWTKVPSLHITLVFIGYVDNEQMLAACKIAREVASKFDQFFISFKKIILGPLGKAPRMIWLEGEAGKELGELKKALEEALLDGSTGFYKPEKRAFNPHITLARARAGQEELLKDAATQIEEDFKAQFDVNSIEVMESNLKFDGAEYATLESCPVGE